MQVTGSTTDNWQEVLRWACMYINKKTIIVSNTGSNSMDVQINVTAHADSVEHIKYNTTIDAGKSSEFILNDAYAQIIIKTKSTTSGSPTTFVIDYVGW